MAKAKAPEIPDTWTRSRHKEIETHGIGEGFALFDEPGEKMRGVCRTFFPTKHGKAVAVQLTEKCGVRIFRTEEGGAHTEIIPKVGELVNLSLSGVDLERKLGPDLRDVEVGIQFTHEITTKAGAMKVYRVVIFQDEFSL